MELNCPALTSFQSQHQARCNHLICVFPQLFTGNLWHAGCFAGLKAMLLFYYIESHSVHFLWHNYFQRNCVVKFPSLYSAIPTLLGNTCRVTLQILHHARDVQMMFKSLRYGNEETKCNLQMLQSYRLSIIEPRCANIIRSPFLSHKLCVLKKKFPLFSCFHYFIMENACAVGSCCN